MIARATTGLVALGQHLGGEGDAQAIVTLGCQAIGLGKQTEELVARALQRGVGLDPAEFDELLIGDDVVTFVDQDFAHDAAFQALDRLAVAFRLHRAVADVGAAEGDDRRPDADDAEGQEDDSRADDHDAANIMAGAANVRHDGLTQDIGSFLVSRGGSRPA